MALRGDGRADDELRPLGFEMGFVPSAGGSCLARSGGTRVLCTASLENRVPAWMAGKGRGWLSAEYAMLPASTGRRKAREGRNGKGLDGRSVEIQRLIGRALRTCLDFAALGERKLVLDCDVIEADGGTRTCAINGAFAALSQILHSPDSPCPKNALKREVAAVSVGVVDGEVLLDLCYEEDSRADADINIVLAEDGGIIEIQGSSELGVFSRIQLERALELAAGATQRIIETRRATLA